MFDAMEVLAAGMAAMGLEAPGRRGLAVLRARPTRDFAPGALVCEQGFRPLHDALAAQGIEVAPVLPPDAGPFPAAAVVLTRHRAENRANVARAWAMTAPGGAVLVVGAKTDGVESLQRDLRRRLPVEAVPRAHGRVLRVERSGSAPADFADWLAKAAPAPRVVGPGGRRFVTAAGVFSWTAADEGSALLAGAAPRLAGRVADLGAGWGFLSAAALERGEVERLDLVEAEHAALACARLNVTDARAAFHWADATDAGLEPGTFDAVVSNPPFHDGRAVAQGLAEGFVAAAARLLRPSGALVMVASRAVPAEKIAEARFAAVEEIASDRRYRVLRASRPRRARDR